MAIQQGDEINATTTSDTKPVFVTHSHPASARNTSLDASQDGPTSVDNSTTESQVQQRSRYSRWCYPFKTLLFQVFALLWLLPIIILLVLNGKQKIIGASANCTSVEGGCLPDVYSSWSAVDALVRAASLDKRTHDLLGGLQLVAKALEIWFAFIASWLVYMMTMFLASSGRGLPIEHLYKSTEYADPVSGFKSLFGIFGGVIASFRQAKAKHAQNQHHQGKLRLFLFILATVLLCGIMNLMGPSVAILLIPTLQWIDVDPVVDSKFISMNANTTPTASDSWLLADSGCTQDNFAANDYGCAETWSLSLDGWASGYMATEAADSAVSVQGELMLTYNRTRFPTGYANDAALTNPTYELVTFIPNRHVLDGLWSDMRIVRSISQGNDTLAAEEASYVRYNKTVQTFLQRHGPIVGAISNVWFNYDDQLNTTINVGPQKQVRCYASYNSDNTPLNWQGDNFGSYNAGNWTRCIPIGAGWNDGYQTTNFSIRGNYDIVSNRTQPDVAFTVHSTSRAAFLPNGTVPAGLEGKFSQSCLTSNSSAGCDWEALFSSPIDGNIFYRSQNVTTWELVSDSDGEPGRIGVAIDFVAMQTFGNYTLDPSSYTNPNYLTDYQLSDSQTTIDNMTALRVDPAWTLAAWSVAAGGEVEGNRSAGTLLQSSFDHLYLNYNTTEDPLTLEQYRLTGGGLMSILQMLSLMDYTTVPAGDNKGVDPKLLMSRAGRIQVYSFGLFGRTAKLGFAVAIIGCVIVFIEVCVGLLYGLWLGRGFRSPLELLLAALQHPYSGEMDSMDEKERRKHLSRLPVTLTETKHGAGPIRFEQVRYRG
ncbi:hypothetical protein HII31_01088 [Pseudocercospora fuligena]|uniref:Uncharacterized protein n=1 Tax=Pseudocercospora fuligena TaxID=685502 RepID=A0A8H6VSW5_9PEZI|nr:hypothetical protein HII31_01088 [Pseudocercospora fuligena]